MTIFRFSFLIVFAALSGCSPEEDKISAPALSAEQQAARVQKCMAKIEPWRLRGVWIHGGVQPAVNRDAWGALDEKDQREIADIAACISTAGAFQAKEIEIVSEGFKVSIETIRSDNLLFAGEVMR